MEDGISVRADGLLNEVLGIFQKGGPMNEHKAGLVNGTLKTGVREVCAHQRLVDEQVNSKGEKTGYLVCLECGEVIHDQMEA